MYFLYDIVLFLATPLILVYDMVRAWRRRKRRKGIAERLGKYDAGMLTDLAGQKTVWVHAVSVGETIAVKPLIKALKEELPGIRIVLSNVTETGRSIAEKSAGIDHCIYFPFDYHLTTKRAMARIRPALAIIVETEIWPNFLRAARERGIPVLLVNGRISDRSFPRYLSFRRFFRPVLANVSAFCMQTAEDARRIIAIGAEPDRVQVTGNLKYDIPVNALSSEKRRELRETFKVPGGAMVIIAGSTHAGEEELILSAYQRLLAKGRECFLVLVPRHPERAAQVVGVLNNFAMRFTLRSALDQREGEFGAGEVLLVDTVGELMRFYAISDIAFVGGSLVPTGGFGPHMHNFRESAALLLSGGGGFQVKDREELASLLLSLLDDPEKRSGAGRNGMRLLLENNGATKKQMDVIKKMLAAGH